MVSRGNAAKLKVFLKQALRPSVRNFFARRVHVWPGKAEVGHTLWDRLVLQSIP